MSNCQTNDDRWVRCCKANNPCEEVAQARCLPDFAARKADLQRGLREITAAHSSMNCSIEDAVFFGRAVFLLLWRQLSGFEIGTPLVPCNFHLIRSQFLGIILRDTQQSALICFGIDLIQTVPRAHVWAFVRTRPCVGTNVSKSSLARLPCKTLEWISSRTSRWVAESRSTCWERLGSSKQLRAVPRRD